MKFYWVCPTVVVVVAVFFVSLSYAYRGNELRDRADKDGIWFVSYNRQSVVTAAPRQRASLTTKRYVKPGPLCYYCLKNCSEDWTSDVVKTCTADQICVRKWTSVLGKDGHTTIQRSSGCTYMCKVGVLVSTSFNMTTRCCESYLDKSCSVTEYTAEAYRPRYKVPYSTLAVIGIINVFAAYFF